MKILHLSTRDMGRGAARGSYWLHKSLLARGIDSKLLVKQKESYDPEVLGPSSSLSRGIQMVKGTLDRMPLELYPGYDRKSSTPFSPGWVPGTVHRKIREIDPDIVHLHWICEGFVNPQNIRKIEKPIVWTLRDTWAYTGGCHYSYDCYRYENSCGKCPQLGSNREHDLSRRIWNRKKRAWAKLDISIVAISNWLADCARNSSLFKNYSTSVVPNGLDTGTYRPIEKSTARRLLKLPEEKKIILFGAFNVNRDPIKGFGYFKEALEQLSQRGWDKTAEAVVFGNLEASEPVKHGLKVRRLGILHDDLTLALVYSAGDVMVVPSRQEAFGKTAMEALACGTPVVSFDTTGLRDQVEHKRNGYRARCFDIDDLTEGIQWVLGDRDRLASLSKRAREKVLEEFTQEIMAEKYIAIYREILGKNP